jgi:hypothetical protein
VRVKGLWQDDDKPPTEERDLQDDNADLSCTRTMLAIISRPVCFSFHLVLATDCEAVTLSLTVHRHIRGPERLNYISLIKQPGQLSSPGCWALGSFLTTVIKCGKNEEIWVEH